MFQPINNSLIADITDENSRGLIYGISFGLSFGIGSFILKYFILIKII